MLDKIRRLTNTQKIVLISMVVLLVGAIVASIFFISAGIKKRQQQATAEETLIPDEEDPQSVVVEEQEEESGAEVDITKIVDENRTDEITYGIDVSYHQGNIDWKKVAESGVDFAMVRVGYRTLKTGEIIADKQAKYNMQEAQKYGIKVGAYFFSTAITNEEAIEEAKWVADYIAKYQITYPVAYDCEGFEKSSSRQYGMTIEQRTDTAVAFLDTIIDRGYSPMFYGSKSDMEDEMQWDMDRISSLYSVWVAQYPSVPYPQTSMTSYSGTYSMWQYTNKGTVPGIKGSVDMNVAYFGYANAEGPHDNSGAEYVGENVEAGMNFSTVNEMVTAKEKTNLRDKPSQGNDSKVMHTLVNGQTATRTGVSSSGWSRVVYNGDTYYAVSSYLTTDLSYKPPQEEPDDGIVTEFKSVNEQMTAKEAVNLRKKPSVNDEIAPVVVQIKNGDVVTRTGINTDVGWSRVVYNGQTLYCVSSYLMPIE